MRWKDGTDVGNVLISISSTGGSGQLILSPRHAAEGLKTAGIEHTSTQAPGQTTALELQFDTG